MTTCDLLSSFRFDSFWSVCQATANERYLFARVCGFSGVNAAFSIALKQRFAERPVFNYSALAVVKIKVHVTPHHAARPRARTL